MRNAILSIAVALLALTGCDSGPSTTPQPSTEPKPNPVTVPLDEINEPTGPPVWTRDEYLISLLVPKTGIVPRWGCPVNLFERVKRNGWRKEQIQFSVAGWHSDKVAKTYIRGGEIHIQPISLTEDFRYFRLKMKAGNHNRYTDVGVRIVETTIEENEGVKIYCVGFYP